MSDLTEFLLARIAEDEAVARAAGELRPDLQPDRRAPWADPNDVEVRLSPVRVLAECEAKRQVAKAVEGWKHAVVEDCWYTCAAATEDRDGGECCDDGRSGGPCDCGRDYRAASILAPLALPYADHPDYLEEWRP